MSRVGRPREFDRDEAVRRAMKLFWAKGYEATSLTELQDVMGGITAPSFYAAFGSKEALFREAVELYKDVEGAAIARALEEGLTARAAVEAMLRRSVASICSNDNPRGCLIVLGGVNCSSGNKGIEEFLREQRALREQALRRRLRQGIMDGDLPAGADVGGLANFYTSILDGLAMRAKDGASRKVLGRVVTYAMAAWEAVV